MPSQRDTAQKERAEARNRRRSKPEEPDNGTPTDDHGLDGVKQAAKVAAASIMLGAVTAAARALAERRHSSDDSTEAEPTEPETESQDDPPEAQAEPESEPAAKEEAEQQEPEPQQEPPRQEQDRPLPEPRRAPPQHSEPVSGVGQDEAKSVADAAIGQLQLLVGKEPETLSALERTDNGWLATLEVVEVSRIPESTDVLASYEVELDDDRNLRRYARVRRYNRSQAEREGSS